MAEALQELPLAIFSTLAPIGAGAFIALFIAFLKKDFSDEQLKKIDKFTIVPILVAVVALCAAFAHLATPSNAMNVASTVGSTPMANEITIFGVFMILAVIYWIIGIAGGLGNGKLRKGFSGVLAVGSILVACGIGAAYMLPTIPVWNTILTPIEVIGFTLMGGTLLGLLTLALAGAADQANEAGAAKPMIAVMVLGLVLSLVGVIGIWIIGATTESALLPIGSIVSSLIPAFVFFIILSLIGVVIGVLNILTTSRAPSTTILLVLVIIAVFLARLCFYGMQFGIGL